MSGISAPLVSSEKPIKAYDERIKCSGSTAKLTAGAEALMQYSRPACALGSRHLWRGVQAQRRAQQRASKRASHDVSLV